MLVLTHWFDPTADHVVEELNRRGVAVFRCDGADLFRCDGADFPQALTMSATLEEAWSATLRTGTREVELEEVSGVLYRRPTPFEFPGDMPAQDQGWPAEARIGFGGVLASLDTWLNHPHRMAFAEYQPAQLQAAVRARLAVPRAGMNHDLVAEPGHMPRRD